MGLKQGSRRGGLDGPHGSLASENSASLNAGRKEVPRESQLLASAARPRTVSPMTEQPEVRSPDLAARIRQLIAHPDAEHDNRGFDLHVDAHSDTRDRRTKRTSCHKD